MGALIENGFLFVNHYTPLHYLAYIAMSHTLKGKPTLEAEGFDQSHLRSMSYKQDIARGFGEYAFLTIDSKPRILSAKLAAGFPHIAIQVPSNSIESTPFALCRYNVAMTRRLRRGNKPGFKEGPISGRYYDKKQIPIAVSEEEKLRLLSGLRGTDTMIEVLIAGDLPLPVETRVICYSPADAALAQSVIHHCGNAWGIEQLEPPGPYPRNEEFGTCVESFTQKLLADPAWRGNGLEFDRVSA